ncbi:MAG: hydroxysqualene dehydroxylase HpnE [Vicinamibacterales bacterium]
MNARRADAVVIGAGWAGLAAAVHLADAGRRVIVVEESRRLGGRATAFTDRATGERVDNGQHVLFGCYRATYDVLRKVGAADAAPLQQALTLVMADDTGRRATLACPPWPPPWHLVGGVLRWSAMPLADRLAARHLRPLLSAARRDGAEAVAARVPETQTVTGWLTTLRQPASLRRWLWDPLAWAALNQDPDVAAARPFVRVLGELFGPRAEDAALGLPAVPLDALFPEPAAAFVRARGGEVRMGAPGRVVVDARGVAGVAVGDEVIETRCVISAVPWHAFGRIWRDDVPEALQPVAASAAAMASSPIVTVNLWFDGPVMTESFLGLVGGPIHWVFDKSAILREPGGHLSVVSSGATDLATMSNEEATEVALRCLAPVLPETRSRTLKRSVVVREPRATFSLAPGQPPRPATVTALPGFFLAGDWIDTGLPATIEGAARSGAAAGLAAARNTPRE